MLAAATSIATKVTEETLTYLNQGQSYEIKLKKVGELSNFRGKILKVNMTSLFLFTRLYSLKFLILFLLRAVSLDPVFFNLSTLCTLNQSIVAKF